MEELETLESTECPECPGPPPEFRLPPPPRPPFLTEGTFCSESPLAELEDCVAIPVSLSCVLPLFRFGFSHRAALRVAKRGIGEARSYIILVSRNHLVRPRRSDFDRGNYPQDEMRLR